MITSTHQPSAPKLLREVSDTSWARFLTRQRARNDAPERRQSPRNNLEGSVRDLYTLTELCPQCSAVVLALNLIVRALIPPSRLDWLTRMDQTFGCSTPFPHDPWIVLDKDEEHNLLAEWPCESALSALDKYIHILCCLSSSSSSTALCFKACRKDFGSRPDWVGLMWCTRYLGCQFYWAQTAPRTVLPFHWFQRACQGYLACPTQVTFGDVHESTFCGLLGPASQHCQ